MADKMTQKVALEYAINMMNEHAGTDEENEARDILQAMLDKKNEKKPRKVDPLTLVFQAKVLEILQEEDKPMTNKELKEALQAQVDAGALELAKDSKGNETKKVTPQRVANNIKSLEESGKIVRIVGGKASDKTTFILA